MVLDIRKQCAVCAWRETCAKKHTLKEDALHCPDFTRDRRLPEDAAGAPTAERHKQVEDVFRTR